VGVAAVDSDECSSREASDRADLVELPMMERRKVEAMSPDEASRFLEAARKDQYHTLWCVLLSGGLRPSEALALK
jgi:integrase